jgi:hypothetical protein
LNQSRGANRLFDAFSSREPVTTPDRVRGGLSLEKRLWKRQRRTLATHHIPE